MRTPSDSIKKNLGVGDKRVRSMEQNLDVLVKSVDEIAVETTSLDERVTTLEGVHRVLVVTQFPAEMEPNTLYVLVNGAATLNSAGSNPKVDINGVKPAVLDRGVLGALSGAEAEPQPAENGEDKENDGDETDDGDETGGGDNADGGDDADGGDNADGGDDADSEIIEGE